MNKNQKYFIDLIFVIFVLMSLTGITTLANTPTLLLPDPITGSTTEFGTITSDYGPRNIDVGSGTNPHKGIDYRLTAGGKAFAVESGEIKLIEGIGTKNARIWIGNWRYIHMADNYKSDKDGYWFQTYEKQTVYENGKPTKDKTNIIVFRVKEGGKWVTQRALHSNKFRPFKFKDPDNNNQEVDTTNEVSQGDWIFCARDMSGPHLHIDYNSGTNDLDAGTQNPLRYIAHRDSEAAKITPKFKFINKNQEAEDFPSNILYRDVILQQYVDNTTDYDLESAEVFIKKYGGTEYCPLKKWYFTPDSAWQTLKIGSGDPIIMRRKI